MTGCDLIELSFPPNVSPKIGMQSFKWFKIKSSKMTSFIFAPCLLTGDSYL